MKMDISCDIIRDLLPLYAEDLASEDSRKLVDGHLCSCGACTQILETMKKGTPVPAETAPVSLDKVKKTIQRRRTLSVMAAVLTLISLACFLITWLFAPFQLTKEQALDDFYVREDGAVVIDYSSAVTGRCMSGSGENWFINQYSTRYDVWKGLNRKSLEETFGTDGIITEEERTRYDNIDVVFGNWESADGKVKSDAPIPGIEDAMLVTGGNEWNWWYADPWGMGRDIMLHDAGKGHAHQYTFSRVYPMIFFGGIAAILILMLLRKITKKSWLKELFTRLMILSGSCVFSVLFVSSGRIFTSDVGIIDQYWGPMIGMNAVFLTLTLLFWRQLYLLNQQDKAV